MLENLLSSDGYIVTNKEIIRKAGLLQAVLLGELYSEYAYWKKEDKLTSDEYFFSTRENIEYNTGLSSYQQRKALEKLEELNIIKTKTMGIPAKTYYKINEESVLNLLNSKMLKNLTTGGKKTSQQETKKLHINNNNNNNKNKNKSIKTGKTKKDNYLDMILSKLQEYDFSEKVQEKILDYYSDQIDRKNYPADNQLTIQFDTLAKQPENKILMCIDKAIAGGWKSMLYGLENSSNCRPGFVESAKDDYYIQIPEGGKKF